MGRKVRDYLSGAAVSFLDTLEANVKNQNLTDEQFRQFVANSLEGLREHSMKLLKEDLGFDLTKPKFYDMNQ